MENCWSELSALAAFEEASYCPEYRGMQMDFMTAMHRNYVPDMANDRHVRKMVLTPQQDRPLRAQLRQVVQAAIVFQTRVVLFPRGHAQISRDLRRYRSRRDTQPGLLAHVLRPGGLCHPTRLGRIRQERTLEGSTGHQGEAVSTHYGNHRGGAEELLPRVRYELRQVWPGDRERRAAALAPPGQVLQSTSRTAAI